MAKKKQITTVGRRCLAAAVLAAAFCLMASSVVFAAAETYRSDPDPDAPLYDRGWFYDPAESASQNTILPGVWVCDREMWTEESRSMYGRCKIRFNLDGSAELWDESRETRTGNYLINIVPEEENPAALLFIDGCRYIVSVYQMTLEVYGFPEISRYAGDGSIYTSKVWGFYYSDNSEDYMDEALYTDEADDTDAADYPFYEIESAPAQDGKVCLFITNDDDIAIDEFAITANFTDEYGNVIGSGSGVLEMLPPHHTAVLRVDGPSYYFGCEPDVSIQTGTRMGCRDHAADVDITFMVVGDDNLAVITNNGSHTIDRIEYTPVFYLADQLVYVGLPKNVYGVPAGAEVEDIITVPDPEDDSAPPDMIWDMCRIYVSRAETYGTE